MTLRTACWVTVLAVSAAYVLHVLYGEFVYEDGAWLAMAAGGQAGGFWPRGLAQRLWIWQGSDPQTIHAVSLFLHGTNAALVYLLARRLGLRSAFAGLAAVLFYAHRLGVETVAYAAQQGELIAAAGVLGACVVAAGQWRWWTAPAIGALLLVGMGGKETAIVGVLLVPLTCWVTKADLWELAAWLGLFVAVIGVIVAGGPVQLANIGQSVGAEVTALEWLLIQSTAVVRTFGLLLVPIGLTVDYDYDIVPIVYRWMSLGILVGLTVLAIAGIKRWTFGAFCLGSMLLVILPRLIVQTPRGNFNDHHAYLMIPFFALLVAHTWERVLEYYECRDTSVSLS